MKNKFLFPQITSLTDCLELTDSDLELQKEIRALYSQRNGNVNSVETSIFNKISLNSDITRLIRLSESDYLMKHYCDRKELNNFWEQVLSLYISDNGKVLRPQPLLSNFTLVCGYYYHNRGLAIRKIAEKSFTPLELDFFNHALNYSSIHSVIELNKFDYSEIEKGSEPHIHAQNAINRSLAIVEAHKSAAYLLLIESYIRYIQYLITLQEEEQATLIKQCMQSAMHAFEKMKIFLSESAMEIENASFGEGIGSLNSLNLSTLEEIEDYLEDYSNQLSKSISLKSNI